GRTRRLRRRRFVRHTQGGRPGRRYGRGRCAALLGAGELRRHQRLLNLAAAADRAGHEAALGLLVVGRRIGKPAFEAVALLASERVTDHRSPPMALNVTGSASGSTMSNRRPCCSEGTRPRAAATSAGSTLATTMPGSVPPSATIRPQGSTISECPK